MKKKNKDRSAHESMIGYEWQNIRTLYEIITKYFNLNDNDLKKIFIKIEGREDIDIIDKRNDKIKMTLFQNKYYGNTKETISKNSGILKVINANYKDYDNVEEIIIEVAGDKKNKTSDAFTENILFFNELIKKELYDNASIFFSIILLNSLSNKKDEHINLNDYKNNHTSHKDNVNNIYSIINQLNNFDKKNLIEKNNNDNEFNDLLNKTINCELNDYFKKIKFKEGHSYKNIINDMHNTIGNNDEIKKILNINNMSSEQFNKHNVLCYLSVMLKFLVDNLFEQNNEICLFNFKQKINNEFSNYIKNNDKINIVKEFIKNLLSDEVNYVYDNISLICYSYLLNQKKKDRNLDELIILIYKEAKRKKFELVSSVINLVSHKIDYNCLNDRKICLFLLNLSKKNPYKLSKCSFLKSFSKINEHLKKF